MRLHHLLSHDGQQLADFTVSPVRTTHVDIAELSRSVVETAATPLPKLPPEQRIGWPKPVFLFQFLQPEV